MRAALFASLVTSLLASCSSGGDECTCQPCNFDEAVTLTVVDARTGGPVTTFVVDATVNGQPRGQPEACRPELRTGSSCSFGDEGGLYHLVIGAAGYETREVLVRQADRGAGDLCCNQSVCLSSREVTVSLDPLESP